MTKPQKPWACQKCGGLGKIIPRATPRSTICAWCADDLRRRGQRWCTSGRHGVAPHGWAAPTATMCRECQRAYNQAYRAEHRDALIAQSAAYHAAHRDDILAANQIRYAANRAQILDQKRVYYREKRELIKARNRAYYPQRPQASREKARQRQRSKQQIYYYNQKLAQRRRWLASLRGQPKGA